jgi:hypothetical protein
VGRGREEGRRRVKEGRRRRRRKGQEEEQEEQGEEEEGRMERRELELPVVGAGRRLVRARRR